MRTVHRMAAVTAIAALAGVAAVATTAGAAKEHARAPKPAERTGITAATRTAIPAADRGKFQVTGIRVSSRSSYWAKAVISPRPAYRTQFDAAYVILVRSAASGKWTLLDLGTSQVGCAIAPISVLNDLGVGAECGSGDRL